MDEYVPETEDARSGRNIRMLRERKGMTQADLVAAMKARGRKWHQQTVTDIEHGKRPLRYWEAQDLAGALGTSADRFAWSDAEARATEFVYSAGNRARLAWEAVADAVPPLLSALAFAELAARQHEGSEYARVREAVADTLARAEELSLDAAVDEGIRRYESRGGDGT